MGKAIKKELDGQLKHLEGQLQQLESCPKHLENHHKLMVGHQKKWKHDHGEEIDSKGPLPLGKF